MVSSYGPEVKKYIKDIGELPDRILQKHCRTLGTHNEQLLAKSTRKRYRAKSEWLDWLHESTGDPHPDLVFTWKIHYKIAAELSHATLDIAKEILLRVPKPGGIDSAADWWWKWELEGCENALKNQGIIGSPAITGRREWADFSINFLNRVDPDKEDFSLSDLLWGSEHDTVTMTPTIALSRYMKKLQKDDLDFRNTHYMDYTRMERRYVYAVRKSKALRAAVLLPDDEILILDKHSKVPQQYQSYRDPMPELPKKGDRGFARKKRR